MFKRWQKRYFVVASHYMKYYESESDSKSEAKLKGTIDLKEVVKAELFGYASEVFMLHTSSDVTKFKASSPEEAAEWNDAIKAILESVQQAKERKSAPAFVVEADEQAGKKEAEQKEKEKQQREKEQQLAERERALAEQKEQEQLSLIHI